MSATLSLCFRARTMRIFSSAEYCLRVARRISRTSRSDGVSGVLDLGLMLHSSGGYDEPKILLPQAARFVSQVLMSDIGTLARHS